MRGNNGNTEKRTTCKVVKKMEVKGRSGQETSTMQMGKENKGKETGKWKRKSRRKREVKVREKVNWLTDQ